MDKQRHWISYKNAAILLFALLFILICLTFPHYGISWDEHWHLNYGAVLVNYYRGLLSGHMDTQATTYRDLFVYGGVFDLLATVAVKILGLALPFGKMELRHLVTALAGLLGIIGAWATARQLGGDKAGFWAAALLTFTPVYYGHMFFNPKDIPFAAGYIWSLFFLLLLLRQGGASRWRTILGFALVAGLAMGIRVAGMLLIFFLFLVLTWNFWRHIGEGDRRPSWWREFTGRVLLPTAVAGLVAYAVMLIFWPWAQQDPLRNPFIALREISQFGFPHLVLYRGQGVMATDLPPDYLFTYIAISLPELVLLLLATGAGWALVRAVQVIRKKEQLSDRYRGGLLLLAAILTPIFTTLVAGSTLYDGMRHFIFIVPPLACLAGMTFQTLLDWASSRRRWLETVLVALAALFLVYQGSIMIRLHPYEYIYYNQLVGGVTGAEDRFEADYWGTSVSESTRWLVNRLEKQGGLDHGPVAVFIGCAHEFSADYYFPDTLRWTLDESEAQYYIVSNRWVCPEQAPGEEIHRVERFGVPLSIVKQVQRLENPASTR